MCIQFETVPSGLVSAKFRSVPSLLLQNRQDQFVRALVHKLTTYALGRPLTFADRAAIDEITARTRRRGDGLAAMVCEIATSALLQSK